MGPASESQPVSSSINPGRPLGSGRPDSLDRGSARSGDEKTGAPEDGPSAVQEMALRRSIGSEALGSTPPALPRRSGPRRRRARVPGILQVSVGSRKAAEGAALTIGTEEARGRAPSRGRGAYPYQDDGASGIGPLPARAVRRCRASLQLFLTNPM